MLAYEDGKVQVEGAQAWAVGGKGGDCKMELVLV